MGPFFLAKDCLVSQLLPAIAQFSGADAPLGMTRDDARAVDENPVFAGMLLGVVGIESLVVPIPRSEWQGIRIRHPKIIAFASS